MDNRSDIREFLSSRRARITPQQAGLPTYGAKRRVAGLRREEGALLAGVSVDYYARLERGNLSGVSDSVLEGLARALQLDEAERAHLLDLARAASSTPRTRRRSAPQQVRPGVQRLLDGPVASWFRGTQVRHDGRIAASGMSKDVRFVDADGGVNDRLDEAYRTKYRRYPPAIVDSITSRMARSATLKLVPAS